MRLWVVQLMAAAGALACSDTEYLNNDQLLGRLEALAIDNPDLVSIYTIGASVRGVELRVVKLTASPEEAALPKVKFVGGIHGNEPPSTHVLLTFAEELVRGYRARERYTVWLLNNTRIHILARLNPDGFLAALEGDCDGGLGRRNANQVDLNRDFPGIEEEGPAYQPEVAAIIEWSAAERFTLSASLHTGSLVAVYPLDSPIGLADESGKTPDEVVFLELAHTYASNHRTMASGHGCPGKVPFPGGVVNGAHWYRAKGTMMDYNYLIAGTMELTLEINCCKYPHPRFLCPIWEQNKMALLKLTGEAVRGVRGTVTTSGIPLENAMVKVFGKDMPVYTNSRGEFFRILLPGQYTLQVEMVGMESRDLEVEVPRPDTAFLTWAEVVVELVPELADPFSPIVDKGGLDPGTSTEQQQEYFSSPPPSSTAQGWWLSEEDLEVMKVLNETIPRDVLFEVHPRMGNLQPSGGGPALVPLLSCLVLAVFLTFRTS